MGFNFGKLKAIHDKSRELQSDVMVDVLGYAQKEGLNYFKVRKDIKVEQLVKLAKHYHVSIYDLLDDTDNEMLSVNPTDVDNLVQNNNIGVGNVNINNDVKHLKETIKQLNKVIEDKNNMIEWLKQNFDNFVNLMKTKES